MLASDEGETKDEDGGPLWTNKLWEVWGIFVELASIYKDKGLKEDAEKFERASTTLKDNLKSLYSVSDFADLPDFCNVCRCIAEQYLEDGTCPLLEELTELTGTQIDDELPVAKRKRKNNDDNDVSVKEIYDIFIRLSKAYDSKGDEQRKRAFLLAGESIKNLKKVTCGADIVQLKNCGKASVEVVDELITTGGCERLTELEKELYSYDEIVEANMFKRTEELKKMDAPTNRDEAKAFVIIKHKYLKTREKEAQAILKTMDEHLKVIVANRLKKEGYFVTDADNIQCEHCENRRDEEDKCVTCAYVRLEHKANALGCQNLPDYSDY